MFIYQKVVKNPHISLNWPCAGCIILVVFNWCWRRRWNHVSIWGKIFYFFSFFLSMAPFGLFLGDHPVFLICRVARTWMENMIIEIVWVWEWSRAEEMAFCFIHCSLMVQLIRLVFLPIIIIAYFPIFHWGRNFSFTFHCETWNYEEHVVKAFTTL